MQKSCTIANKNIVPYFLHLCNQWMLFLYPFFKKNRSVNQYEITKRLWKCCQIKGQAQETMGCTHLLPAGAARRYRKEKTKISGILCETGQRPRLSCRVQQRRTCPRASEICRCANFCRTL